MVNFIRHNLCISIHAPRTGSDLWHPAILLATNISIHAPRTGSDSAQDAPEYVTRDISIHAPRTGSDGRE